MVQRPRVSVIIPAYQVAPFIADTLRTVFSQTFSDFEVIVVNDGSPDTEEFERAVAPYRDRLVYIKQENRGAAAARNRGLMAAQAEFVAFLDADDVWLPNYLEEQLTFIKAGGYDLVYADALIIGDSPLAGRTFMTKAPSEGEVTVRNLLLARCNVITSGVLARKQNILDVGLFDEALRNSHDFDLWVRLAKSGAKLAYQRKVLLHYRCHENSLSGDAVNNVVRQLKVYEKFDRCYDLSANERADVTRMLKSLHAELELEQGRMHLINGNFAEARTALQNANKFYRSFKLQITLLILRFSPRLLLGLYKQRMKSYKGRRKPAAQPFQ